MNCGFWRAASAMRLYVSSGMAAQMAVELLACRRRQRASISFAGSSRIFSTSRYELSGLMGLELPETSRAAFAVGDAFGGGGGWKAGGVPGTVEEGVSGSGVVTVDALRRRSWILSL